MNSSKDTSGFPARYWHPLADGRVQCDLCPRACVIKNGQRGFCYVRAAQGGKLVLATYGRSSGFCVDPIEKKPLFHFLPGSAILSFGTAGCNLSCKFCQNWDISRSRQADTLAAEASPEDIAKSAKKSGCASVAFTYNDPVIFLEYAVDTAKACHALGIKTVAVTAGYVNPEPAREFYSHMDAANVDLKGFSEKFYRDFCQASLKPVLDGLVYIKKQAQTWLELTTLLVPGENDDPKELESMCRWIRENLGPDVPLHFTAFHPAYRVTNKPATPPQIVSQARDIAQRTGLHYVYTGNVHAPEGENTYCVKCREKTIGRDWFEITKYGLDAKGNCLSCQAPCAGVFDGPAGDWGGKCVPVSI